MALPSPGGSPAELRSAARSLECEAARARSTTTVGGTLGSRLGAVWTGAAATAARSEADELGRRSRGVVDALTTTARSLLSYAAALDHAVGRTRALQRQWDALDAEHALAARRLVGATDPTGVVRVLGLERAHVERAAARARLSRCHAGVLDELRAVAKRCAHVVAGVTDATLPSTAPATPANVRDAVTGSLWFADGVVSARASRTAALDDAALVRRALQAVEAGDIGGWDRRADDVAIAQIVHQVRDHADDPVYAQTLLTELGGDGLSRLLMGAGVAGGSTTGAHVDTVRNLLGAFGSLVVTGARHTVPVGTDPRTRAQLASGAALLADDLVAGAARVHADASGRDGATGAWLLGQLLSGARATGDDRRLPARLVRRAAAAAAAAEIAETRDADLELRHGTTLRPDAEAAFASWFDDAAGTGDALHVLLSEVGDHPAEQAAVLAEPLPGSSSAGGALANARGDRLTLGEHLVRRWITLEATGIESHPDLRLATDGDLQRLLPSISCATTADAAETRARVMLELSRSSSLAMAEASTTRLYTRATAPVEGLVVEWFSAMRANVDRALVVPSFGRRTGYAAETGVGLQPALDADELSGVIAALTIDTGMGLHAKDPGAGYVRLVESEIAWAERSVAHGRDVAVDVARLGFLDQSASAALVAVAHRQDELNRAALQGAAEAKNVIEEIRKGGPVGLMSTAQTYVTAGTSRTAGDDLVITLVRSNVELAQTERDDARHAALVARIEAFTGRRPSGVRASMETGAGRARAVPAADALRAARDAEIRAAWEAYRDSAVHRCSTRARVVIAEGSTTTGWESRRPGLRPRPPRASDEQSPPVPPSKATLGTGREAE
ncbi:hypothetical protein [Terrabacter sp. MAHUQ-38]|uniref:hypothetical protein n=1 Tax=unclassified Terrabacter TaxID=2630222 RepID=UPI00165E648D|nr:hypothetical protein [Terrabacter sp. MAHUQ-38]MBC9822952.1 hypothetical protein [Terrabacter sp. MAHUQ-38]